MSIYNNSKTSFNAELNAITSVRNIGKPNTLSPRAKSLNRVANFSKPSSGGFTDEPNAAVVVFIVFQLVIVSCDPISWLTGVIAYNHRR